MTLDDELLFGTLVCANSLETAKHKTDQCVYKRQHKNLAFVLNRTHIPKDGKSFEVSAEKCAVMFVEHFSAVCFFATRLPFGGGVGLSECLGSWPGIADTCWCSYCVPT